MAVITIANQAAGGTRPTSPARAAQPNSAPADVAPNTRKRPRGSRLRRAMSAHAPIPTPAKMTTRCMRSTNRLITRVYALRIGAPKRARPARIGARGICGDYFFRLCIAASWTQARHVIATETPSAVDETVVPPPPRVRHDLIKSGVERINEIKVGGGFRDLR